MKNQEIYRVKPDECETAHFVISDQSGWRPGAFETRAAAEIGLQMSDKALMELTEVKDGSLIAEAELAMVERTIKLGDYVYRNCVA